MFHIRGVLQLWQRRFQQKSEKRNQQFNFCFDILEATEQKKRVYEALLNMTTMDRTISANLIWTVV